MYMYSVYSTQYQYNFVHTCTVNREHVSVVCLSSMYCMYTSTSRRYTEDEGCPALHQPLVLVVTHAEII